LHEIGVLEADLICGSAHRLEGEMYAVPVGEAFQIQ
jgi:hypothetical protein